jgi:predicted nucleic acid-binding protein
MNEKLRGVAKLKVTSGVRTTPTMRKVVADSGPLLALFNRADRWHAPVLQWLETNPQARLLTTWPVLTEVCALLARRLGNEAALDFLRWCQRGGVTLDTPAADTLPETLAQVLLISERFRDLPFDLADASVAEAAARHGIRHVLTIDSDFDVYRDAKGKALRYVLRDGW